MERTPAEVGEIVRARREYLGRTQVEVVQRARDEMGAGAISEPTYRAVERGRTEPSGLTMAAIARGLDWPTDALKRIRAGEDPPEGKTVTVEPARTAVTQQDQLAAEVARLAARLEALEGQVGHILGMADGGTSTPDNLRVLTVDENLAMAAASDDMVDPTAVDEGERVSRPSPATGLDDDWA